MFGSADQGEMPNMQLNVMEFGNTILLFATRRLVAGGGHLAVRWCPQSDATIRYGLITYMKGR